MKTYQHGNTHTKPELIVELVGGEPYEYYPLGDYIVRAVGICGGRPTFKYTRIDVDFILKELALGQSIDYLIGAYRDSNLSKEAIQEALMLATSVFQTHYQTPLPTDYHA